VLTTLSVRGFKSLAQVDHLELAPLTLFFGPNAAGKSNLLDAIHIFSRLATTRTVAEALGGPVRGLPLEAFNFPGDGLPGLLATKQPTFRLEGEITRSQDRLRYAVEIAIAPKSGTLTVADEYLARLRPKGTPWGNPVIERHRRVIRVRRKSKPAHPWEEPVGLNHTLLSNKRYSGKEYAALQDAREALSAFRAYYLDPRVAMRAPKPPEEVDDIGPLGENLAPFLYRLQAEAPKVFQAVRRTLCTLVPSVDDLVVDLDDKRGVINVEIRQDGTPYSARIISEGTLRVLALICVATNPWGGSLVAFEEPENGVHPRRIELIADILGSLALQESPRRQVILTSHSPLFCGAVLRLAREHDREVRLYRVVREGRHTRFLSFDPNGPLFTDHEIADALTAPSEDGTFEALVLRGLLDG